MNLEDNLFGLHYELKDKSYRHSHYTAFSINDPKPRLIHKACVRDRVLHHAIFRVLYPIFDKGLPLGNVTSQLFANIYLNELDQFIKHDLHKKYYLRYCDDFVILGQKEEFSAQLPPIIASYLKGELKLILHPDKIVIRKYRQGVDFLGYVVLPHYRALRAKTKNRILKKIKINRENLKNGLISKRYFHQSLQSYLGILTHCEGYKINGEIKSLV